MRLLLQIRGRTLDVTFTREQPPPPGEPQRDVDLYSSPERANQWDHDQRQPIGYRRNG